VTIRQTAIVGAGPAGLIAYLILRYHGVPAHQIVVLDDRRDVLDAWAACSAAIAQRAMRSESEGHFFATDFPGFALLDSIRERSPLPLLRSVFNRYHPTLRDVVSHGRGLASYYDLDASRRYCRVTAVRREMHPSPHLTLETTDGTVSARHVLLALGHGPLRWPAVDPEALPELAGRLTHAYQPKDYRPGKTVVIGSGMAATGEWVNALRAGAEVVAVRRRPVLTRQALSAPRCAFGGGWLDRYHRLPATERARVLANLGRGSSPRPREWSRVLSRAEREGRLSHRVGDVLAIAAHGPHIDVHIQGEAGEETLAAESVIAATGFRYGWREHGITRDLVDTYGLATYGDHLILADDCVVPRLSRPDSVVAVTGPLSRWAFPAADSFAAVKYAGRRFTEHATGQRAFGPQLRGWIGMVRAGLPSPEST